MKLWYLFINHSFTKALGTLRKTTPLSIFKIEVSLNQVLKLALETLISISAKVLSQSFLSSIILKTYTSPRFTWFHYNPWGAFGNLWKRVRYVYNVLISCGQ